MTGADQASVLQIFASLGVALAVGLLIGMERGWERRAEAEGQRVAGLRTFGLIGLAGGLFALLAERLSMLFLAVPLLALAALLVVAYRGQAKRRADYGITSEIAALVTFALGAVAVLGYPAPAAAAAVVVAALLGFKPELHGWLERLDRDELVAALQLLLISVVILPVLPDRGFGPWQALNPWHLWWMVVLIAGISFVGHFAVRIAGERRGIFLTGIFGGLASSTALTLSFARFARDRVGQQPLLALGVLVAAAIMFPRMLVEVAVVNDELLAPAIPGLLAMTAVGFVLAFAGVWIQRASAAGAGAAMGRPFQLKVALQFAALLAAVSVLSEAAQAWYGEAGVYALAFLSGIADVDAITLSLARMADGSLNPDTAVNGMLIAAVTNTLVKAGMVAVIAGGRMARTVLLGAGLMALTGLAFVIPWTSI